MRVTRVVSSQGSLMAAGVKIHLGHIYVKLGVESRTGAALRAVESLSRRRRPE